jgi:hypothetical protein
VEGIVEWVGEEGIGWRGGLRGGGGGGGCVSLVFA